MANEIDDGGLVYPGKRNEKVQYILDDSEPPAPQYVDIDYPGITRRDWLAGLAMQAFISDHVGMKKLFETGNDMYQAVSENSLAYADALIKKSKEKR